MIEPEQQALGRQIGIGQFVIADGRKVRLGLGPLVGFLEIRIGGGGIVEIAVARQVRHHRLAVRRQMLHQHATGAPMRFAALPGVLGHGETHQRRDLFGLLEIGVRDVLERTALERHDALVAVHVGALVDGHGEVALAEQLARLGLAALGGLDQRVMVEAGIAAKAIGGVEIDHQQVHRPVRLRLQDELAFELQRRADQRGERDGFAQQPGDRRGVVVAVEDGVDGLAQPDHAAAAVEVVQGKGQDDVVPTFGPVETDRAQQCFSHQTVSIPKTQQRIAFCACKRFSASSKTTDCGPSMTSSVTSSPR